MDDQIIGAQANRLGISRRSFLQICTCVGITLGIDSSAHGAIIEAIATMHRPAVIWLHFAECTGCTESMLRTDHPALDKVIFDLISLDYHETFLAAAGYHAETARKASMATNKGKYLLVVEGAIPTAEGGTFCKIGTRTAIEILNECAKDAAAVIALGSCASWGGMPSTGPNPTGCVGVNEVWKRPVVNIPGCSPNPYNFLSTVVYYITYGKMPELDEQGRPKFAYSRLIHENCERRSHFDAGRFAEEFGDLGHRSGWCLYRLGCKGPQTYANCPSIRFGDGGADWPVGNGHPCIGCTEKGVAFEQPIHSLAELRFQTSPASYPRIVEEQGKGVSIASTAVLAGAAGVVVGASAAMAMNLGKRANHKDPFDNEE